MKTTARKFLYVAAVVALGLVFASPMSFAATGNGNRNAGEEATSETDDAAEKARQEGVAKVKAQMKELQDYDAAKDPKLNGLSTAEKKKKYIELVKEHERKVSELKKNEYYSDDDLTADRKSFEEDLGDGLDSSALDYIAEMSDEDFEKFLADAGAEDGEEEDVIKNTDGYGKEEDEEGEDKEQVPVSTQEEYLNEEMKWYEDWEGMTAAQIKKERAALNQAKIDKALEAFAELAINPDVIGQSFGAAKLIIDAIPGWDEFNDEMDKLINGGLDNLMTGILAEKARDAVNDVAKRKIQNETAKIIGNIMPGNPVSRSKTSASSLLLASDGTLLVDDEPEGASPDDEFTGSPIFLDEASFADFDWSFGGFRGGGAVLADGTGAGDGPVIDDLRMGRDGLSFSYEEGLSSWGLSNDEAGALACLFVLDNDGNWVGGKFDWISTSRDRRDFENIYSGYEGWDLSNVPRITTAAFVIVSKDGKKRSNVITSMWER